MGSYEDMTIGDWADLGRPVCLLLLEDTGLMLMDGERRKKRG